MAPDISLDITPILEDIYDETRRVSSKGLNLEGTNTYRTDLRDMVVDTDHGPSFRGELIQQLDDDLYEEVEAYVEGIQEYNAMTRDLARVASDRRGQGQQLREELPEYMCGPSSHRVDLAPSPGTAGDVGQWLLEHQDLLAEADAEDDPPGHIYRQLVPDADTVPRAYEGWEQDGDYRSEWADALWAAANHPVTGDGADALELLERRRVVDERVQEHAGNIHQGIADHIAEELEDRGWRERFADLLDW